MHFNLGLTWDSKDFSKLLVVFPTVGERRYDFQRLSIAKMDASFHFMRWSLVQECLATADFSSSVLLQLVLYVL